MQVLIVEFRIKPAHVDDFARAIEENARASRDSEPGCRQFDICRDPADAQIFFLYELYDDEAAVQAHLQAAHFLHMNAASAGWVETKTVRRYRRTAP
jgi:quinol monooxygenase YgiN